MPATLRRASVFARILDVDAGGHCALQVLGATGRRRRYLGESLVLETTVDSPTGSVRIVDAFTMHEGGAERPHNQLLRVVEGRRGTITVDVVVQPRYDHGTLRPWLRYHQDTGAYPRLAVRPGWC